MYFYFYLLCGVVYLIVDTSKHASSWESADFCVKIATVIVVLLFWPAGFVVDCLDFLVEESMRRKRNRNKEKE